MAGWDSIWERITIVGFDHFTYMQAISLIEVPLSMAVNYFLVVQMDMQYLGAALSLSVGNLIDLLLMLIYVVGSGQSSMFLALPSRRALQASSITTLAYQSVN
jgi:Na+-driven multidrug efflux pump